MLFQQKTLRRNYNPLTYSCSLQVVSGEISQFYNTPRNTYSPDRGTSNLVLQPKIQAYSVDGTMVLTDITKSMATLIWQVATDISDETNWRDISSQYTATTDYSIDAASASDTFGRLTFKKNLPAWTTVYFRIKATYIDARRAMTDTIISDPIEVRCVEQAVNEVRLHTDSQLTYQYNPFFDTKTQYIYFCLKVGKNIESVNWSKYNIIVKNAAGTTIVNYNGTSSSDGYLSKVGQASVDGFTRLKLSLNQGYGATDQTYNVQLVKAGTTSPILDQRKITLKRLYPAFDIINQNNSTFEPSNARVDTCIVTSNGRRVTNPWTYLTIKWKVTKIDGKDNKSSTPDAFDVTQSSGTVTLPFNSHTSYTEGFNLAFDVDYKSQIS